MTVAVCHSGLRRSVAAGDVVIFLACRERSPRIQPPAFRGALYALPAGVRVVLGILRVTLVETAAAYHGENENRLDKWYRPCRGRERAVCAAPGSRRFTLRYRVRFGPGPRPRARDHHRNLRHCVPSGTVFWRSDARLQRAPIIPRTLASCIFGGGWQGRGVKYLSGKAREEACKFLLELPAAPPTSVH